MAEYTGFNDDQGNKIWSDSKIEYCNTAPIFNITTEYLILKEDGVYGIDYHGGFNSLESFAKVWDYSSGEERIIIRQNIPYVGVVKEHTK